VSDDKEAWRAYWGHLEQPWRTESEIDVERQKYLAERRSIKPDIDRGIYPFQGIKLSRADVEWLLVTHENGRGPVDWSDERQRNRKGVDLRGAVLSTIDLTYLPLARTIGGLTVREWDAKELNQRDAARIHLEGARLYRAHLESVDFSGAYMETADLSYVLMELSYLVEVHLEGARLHKAHLEHAYLREAHLEGSHITQAYLYETDLSLAHLEGKEMIPYDLKRVQMSDQSFPALLPPAELNGSFFDSGTKLENISFGDKKHGFVSLADLHWGDANLLTVNWTAVNMLGDEWKAKQQKNRNGEEKDRQTQLQEHLVAVRANRQAAVGLQNQGLNEEAARFAYRAQLLQRIVFRRRHQYAPYLLSGFLDLVAGYGYKPWRALLAYLVVIVLFAISYFIIGHIVGPSLSPLGAWVFSMTSFHGRGFFPGGIKLDDPLTVLAAFEAFVGLLIEVTFIGTLTQRLFGK